MLDKEIIRRFFEEIGLAKGIANIAKFEREIILPEIIKAKKEVFEVMDIIINYKPDDYRLKRYEEEKKHHLSTFQKKSDSK